MNKFYGRPEILQNSPKQLEFTGENGAVGTKWFKALTVGYERTLVKKGQLWLFTGGSYAKDIVPTEFHDAYGSDPRGVTVYLRIRMDGSLMAGK